MREAQQHIAQSSESGAAPTGAKHLIAFPSRIAS
jgi:hypothetical protein